MKDFFFCKTCGAVLADVPESWRKHGMAIHGLDEHKSRYNLERLE